MQFPDRLHSEQPGAQKMRFGQLSQGLACLLGRVVEAVEVFIPAEFAFITGREYRSEIPGRVRRVSRHIPGLAARIF